ncbi:MAG: PEP-CTERM sorting domain-containing protein [Burkholderiaceae bacterium]
MSTWKSLAAGLVASLFSGSVFAGLVGTTFDVAYYLPDSSSIYADASFSPPTFTVGPGVETIGDVEGVTFLHLDLTDTGITVDFETRLSNPTWLNAPFNGIILTATGPLGVTDPMVDISTLSGFDGSRVSIDGNRILLNWSGLSYVNGNTFTVSFADVPVSVPEPGSLALLGLGFALVTWRRRAHS